MTENTDKIQLVECPRDAMQGWAHQIPAAQKIAYIKSLLSVGFHTLDCGSFVSAKAIPQMADTREVIEAIGELDSPTKLLTIVLNKRGAEDALSFPAIDYLGFPFSVSETFQQRNGNSTILQNFERLQEIQDLALRAERKTVVYISMAFGNPYADAYSAELVEEWIHKISATGIQTISLADTVGLATAEEVSQLSTKIINAFPSLNIGVHLHSDAVTLTSKLSAAYDSGIRRFDGALLGIGGCPMSGNDLVGNMQMEKIISYFNEKEISTSIDDAALQDAIQLAKEIFS